MYKNSFRNFIAALDHGFCGTITRDIYYKKVLSYFKDSNSFLINKLKL